MLGISRQPQPVGQPIFGGELSVTKAHVQRARCPPRAGAALSAARPPPLTRSAAAAARAPRARRAQA
jgi:hypothetical protein